MYKYLFYSVFFYTSYAMSATSVTTFHNDNGRSGVNAAETILNTTNTNVNQFGKLFSLAVDGQVYAQPLYLQGQAIPGQGIHNVVYIVTEANSVYAFDADTGSGLWHVNLGAPMLCSQIPGCNRDLLPTIGITSTPVIDVPRNALDVVAENWNGTAASVSLHSLNLSTGKENAHSPVVITGSVTGTGDNSSGGVVAFDPFMHWQRAGLLLLNGNIYIGFAGHQDTVPYHGWIFGYDGASLRRVVVKCLSPNGTAAGIWQSGGAMAADAQGNMYVETGNGTSNAWTGGSDYGMSLVKMNGIAGLTISGYFSPSNEATLDAADRDFGSGSPLLIPGTSSVVAGSKDGRIFVLDTDALEGWNSTDKVQQEWFATNAVFGANVYYNSTLYVWGRQDTLKSFAWNGNTFSPIANGSAVIPFDYQNCAAMSVSASGTAAGTGILWGAYSKSLANGGQYPGILRAYDASDVTKELWNSDMNASRDAAGSWAKWVPPTVVNGRVYLATFDNIVNVYGLLN
jgi:outer membrane protein assembly factor BamB